MVYYPPNYQPEEPKPEPEMTAEQINLLPATSFIDVDLSTFDSQRELDRVWTPESNIRDLGFFGKLGQALKYDTVIGEGIRDYMMSPDFVTDKEFVATPEVMEQAAYGLDEETKQRIGDIAVSYAHLLHEADDARRMQKYREELFKGGILDKAGGVLAMIVGSGSEAVALTALASAAGFFAGGPVGSGAAAVSTTGMKVKRLKTTLSAIGMGWSYGRKARGAAKAATTALAIDVPLEMARYGMDKTLRPRDVFFAVAASGSLSAGLGAWKPDMFLRQFDDAVRQAITEESIEFLEATGRTDMAAFLKLKPREANLVDPRALDKVTERTQELRRLEQARDALEAAPGQYGLPGRVVGVEQQDMGRWTDELTKVNKRIERAEESLQQAVHQSTPVRELSQRALESEARRLGVQFAKSDTFALGASPSRNRARLRQQVEEARQRSVEGEMARKQGIRNVEGIEDTAILRTMAEDLGVTVTPGMRNSVKKLKEAIVEAGVTGTKKKSITKIKKFTTSGKNVLRKVSARGTKLNFDSALSHALYRVAGRDFKGREDLISALREYGIDNPEELGKALRQAVDGKVKGYKRKPKSVRVDSEKLLGRKIAGREDAAFDMRLDADILSEYGLARRIEEGSKIDESLKAIRKADKKAMDKSLKKTVKQAMREDVSHPVTDEPDLSIVVDGVETGRGPHIDGVRDVSVDDHRALADDLYEEGGRTAENAKGAEKGSRYAEGGGKETPWWLGGRATHWLNDLLTPVSVRLLKQPSKKIQDFANNFLESPRGGGRNVHALVKDNVQRNMIQLSTGLTAARREAAKHGFKLDEQSVIRAYTNPQRSGLSRAEQLGVEALEKFHKNMEAYATKHGLLKNPLPDSGHYFHRIWSPTSFAKHNEDDMIQFFTEAILSGQRKFKTGDVKRFSLSESGARAAAKRIVKYGVDPQAYVSHKKSQQFLGEVRKDLEKEINEGKLDLNDDEIEAILDCITSKVGNEPHQGFAKHRILLDENYVGTSGAMKDVHIDEFMNRDIEGICAQYCHRLVGAVETRKGMEAVFGRPDITFEEAISDLRIAAKKESPDITAKELDFIETAALMTFRRATGQPLWEAGEGAVRFVMAMQAFAQGTMGQVLGIAQLPEIASVLARTSLTAAAQSFDLKAIPETFLMGLRKEKGLRGADGRLTDKVAAELESFMAVGADYHIGEHLMRRLDDMGYDKNLKQGHIEYFLEKGRMVSLLNPLAIMPMDTFLRRWATKAHFQNFVNEAYKLKDGKPALVDTWWRKSRTRLKQMGLNDNELDRVIKALQDPDVVQVKKGLLGPYKVMDVDFTKVKDQQAYDMLAMAIRRGVDSTVQRQSFGELPLWMSTSLTGKLLTQYRVFAIASRGKQLAAGISRGDATEAVNVVGSMGLGYLGFQLMTYGRALTKPENEREAYLLENSGWDIALKSGFLRSSYSTILPMLVDPAAKLMGFDPVFTSNMRTTGLGINPVEGSVPWSMIKKTESALMALGDSPYTKRDAKDLTRLLWFLKIPGVDQTVNQMINRSNLAESERIRR